MVGFVLVVRWGILAVAASYVVCGYLLAPVSVWSVTRVLDIEMKRYLRLFVAPLTSGLLMVLLLMVAKAALPDHLTGVALLAALLLLAVTVYLVLLTLTGRRLVMSVLSHGRRLLATG